MNISEATIDFVCKHANDDVRKLALSAKRAEGLDLSFALDQIAGRQKARTKLPSWYALAALGEGVDEAHFLVFPPHISMEQCSSEQTARYKKSVLDRILSSILDHPWSRTEARTLSSTRFLYLAVCSDEHCSIEI